MYKSKLGFDFIKLNSRKRQEKLLLKSNRFFLKSRKESRRKQKIISFISIYLILFCICFVFPILKYFYYKQADTIHDKLIFIPLETSFVILIASLLIQIFVTYRTWRDFFLRMTKQYPIPPYLNGLTIKNPLNRKWNNFIDKRLIIMYLGSLIFFIPSFIGTIIEGKTLSLIYLGIGFILFFIAWIIYNIYEYQRSQKSLINMERTKILNVVEKNKNIKIKKNATRVIVSDYSPILTMISFPIIIAISSIMICLKIDNIIKIKWKYVFIPQYILLLIEIAFSVVSIFAHKKIGQYLPLFCHIISILSIIIFTILGVMQLDEDIDLAIYSLIPLWCSICSIFIIDIYMLIYDGFGKTVKYVSKKR